MTCPQYPKIDSLYERDEDFKVDTTKIRRPEFSIPREWLVTEKIHGCNIRVSLELTPICACGDNNVCSDCTKREWVMRFNGRKENSQMPTNLMAYLQDTFTLDGLKSLWRCKKSCEYGEIGWLPAVEFDTVGEMDASSAQMGYQVCPNLEPYSITLYGEGYGGGIQKGGSEYTSKTKGGAVSFRLFDVLVGETWLRRDDVEDVSKKLGIRTVPLLLVPDYASPGGVVGSTRPVLENVVDFVHSGIKSIVAQEEGTESYQAEGIVAFTSEPLYNNRGQRLQFKLKTADFA